MTDQERAMIVDILQSTVDNITNALELGDRGDWHTAEIYLNNQRGITEEALAKL